MLFPSQPFEPKSVDSAFEAESCAAQQAGLDIGLINSEALDQGHYDNAVRRGFCREDELRAWVEGEELAKRRARADTPR